MDHAKSTSRREPRYVARVPINVRAGKTTYELTTEDVSHRGVYLRTQEPLALRQLVQIEIPSPPPGGSTPSISVSAMVVHRVPPGPGERDCGVGLMLYGVGREVQADWDRFVAHLRDEGAPVATVRAANTGGGPLAEAKVLSRTRKRKGTHKAVLRVTVRSLGHLETMVARDLHRGNLFLVAESKLKVGDEIGMEIVHPHTEDVFELAGVVRRRVLEPDASGIEVELVGLDDERRQRFYEFVYDAIANLFDEETFAGG